jgi:hypothetical protein
MKRILSLAVATIVVCLMTTAIHAQSDSLRLRFRVPFPFTVANATFAAGEYEVTEPAHLILELRNLQNQVAAFEHVEPAHSKKGTDGRRKVIFHRYGSEYFLAVVSDGSWQSTYELRLSKKEKGLAEANPRPQMRIVSALSGGAVQATDLGQQ